MTTIVAAYDRKADVMVLGADSQITSEFKLIMKGGKIFNAGRNLAIGVCGVLPPMAVLTDLPDMSADLHGARCLADILVSSLQERGDGSVDADEGVAFYPVAGIIAGRSCGPYYISPTGEIFETTDDYAASGSGAALAMGVLAATAPLRRSKIPAYTARDRVKLALEIAAQHDPSTSGPFTIRTWKGRGR